MQFASHAICNMLICNMCNLQHMQFALCKICRMCNWQHMQFATHAPVNMCNNQHIQDKSARWISNTDQIDGSAGQTSWTDQLDRPAGQTSWTDQFYLFEALASLHIRRFSFQFVHCRSFRVRQILVLSELRLVC